MYAWWAGLENEIEESIYAYLMNGNAISNGSTQSMELELAIKTMGRVHLNYMYAIRLTQLIGSLFSSPLLILHVPYTLNTSTVLN